MAKSEEPPPLGCAVLLPRAQRPPPAPRHFAGARPSQTIPSGGPVLPDPFMAKGLYLFIQVPNPSGRTGVYGGDALGTPGEQRKLALNFVVHERFALICLCLLHVYAFMAC